MHYPKIQNRESLYSPYFEFYFMICFRKETYIFYFDLKIKQDETP